MMFYIAFLEPVQELALAVGRGLSPGTEVAELARALAPEA